MKEIIMTNQELLNMYIDYYQKNLLKNSRVIFLLKNSGIFETFIFKNFHIGYSDRIAPDYSDPDINDYILSPEKLGKKLKNLNT